jgi:hypothetical protein
MAASTTTRLQLFLDIASELGDLITLTADATGTTTTLISTVDMIFPDGSLNGRELWFASGTVGNVGKRRLVTNTDEETGTITFSPAASATASGDVVHLVNSKGTGVTIPEIHNKINQLIRQVREELADETGGTPATFDQSSPFIAIPTTWNYVLGVQYVPSSIALDYVSLLGNAYDIDRAGRRVVINPMHRGLIHNKSVRLVGAIPLATLSTDASTTTVPAHWLAKQATAELLEAAAMRSGDVSTALTYGELVKARAAQLELLVGKRFGAHGRRDYVGATA